jgi:hypothetical protein
MVSLWSDDKKFEDTFHGEEGKSGPFGGGVGRGTILRTTPVDKMRKNTHPVAFMIQEKILSATKTSDTTGWEITLGPGLDPVLIVCIMAVLEHLMGANWSNNQSAKLV